MADSQKISSGVQDLITRLHDEGVQAGENEAERVVQKAEKRAAEIMAQARTEAENALTRAQEQIQAERTAVQDALKLAVRDTVLDLKSRLTSNFEMTVKKLVSAELHDKDFLRQMILAIVDRAAPDAGRGQALDLLLSDELFPVDANGDEPLSAFIQNIAHEVVTEGVELRPAGNNKPGIRLRKNQEELEIDLTDEAIAALLVKHLLPRYRTYVTGEI